MLRRNFLFNKNQCRVWHLVLTVFAMGLTMRMALGQFEIPDPNTPDIAYHYTANSYASPFRRGYHHYDAPGSLADPQDHQGIEVLPIDLNGQVPSPLLSDILKRYMPDATAMHADELRGTLPPGQGSTVVVIMPEENDPIF